MNSISKEESMRGAFFGAMVADALCLGSHYENDALKIHEAYGGRPIEKFMSPGELMGGQTHGIGWGERNYSFSIICLSNYDVTKNALAKLKGDPSFDFVYHVTEASLGAEIDRKNKPLIGINGGINGGSKAAKYHVIANRHVKVVPIESKATDPEDDYLIFKENEGFVVVDSYVDRRSDKSFKIMIDRAADTCAVGK